MIRGHRKLTYRKSTYLLDREVISLVQRAKDRNSRTKACVKWCNATLCLHRRYFTFHSLMEDAWSWLIWRLKYGATRQFHLLFLSYSGLLLLHDNSWGFVRRGKCTVAKRYETRVCNKLRKNMKISFQHDAAFRDEDSQRHPPHLDKQIPHL